MGYRNYLYKVKKKDIEKIRNMSLKELEEKYGDKNEENYVSMHDLLDSSHSKRIFEFGKLYWDDTIVRIHETGEELFTDKEAQERFEDYDPYLVGKEALEVAIEIYTNKIKEMYKNLNDEVDNAETDKEKISFYKKHIQEYMIWWKQNMVIDLEKEPITQSWLYEHLIFELVHLYKTIDFKKYDLIFLGW